MSLGTLGLGAVTAAVVGLIAVVIFALSPAPFAGAFDTRSEQPARAVDVRATDTPTPAATALDRADTDGVASPSAGLTDAAGLRPQSLVVSAFALVALVMGGLLALAYVRDRAG